MNNFFNTIRFCRLFVKHTAEHYRTYLMAIGVLVGVIILGGSFLFFVIPGPPDPGLQAAIFVMLMLIAGTLFSSTVFADFGDRKKAIPTITLPATPFEKYLVGWVYSYPIFLIIYTTVFYLALWGLGVMRHWDANEHFSIFRFDRYVVPTILVIYSLLHSVAIFGAIFFRNLHFIKTGFTFFISYAVLLISNTVFIKLITGLKVIKLVIPFGFLNFNDGIKDYSVAVGGWESVTVLCVLGMIAVLIWVAAYYRLKEKQV